MGVEPTIFTLQKWCIANYATTPFKNLTPIYSVCQIKKTAQTMGIEPITADNLGSILSQRSHQIAASI